LSAMVQLLPPSVSDYECAAPPAVEEVSAATATLNSLLLQRVKLSNDIARMRKLVTCLGQKADPHRLVGQSYKESCSTRASSSPDHRSRPIAKGALRRTPASASTRSRRPKLDRACRIALMETSEPASVEEICNRIERRGSIAIAGYKHPFREIMLAMNVLVKRGEAILLNEAGRSRWRWETERVPIEQASPFTLA